MASAPGFLTNKPEGTRLMGKDKSSTPDDDDGWRPARITTDDGRDIEDLLAQLEERTAARANTDHPSIGRRPKVREAVSAFYQALDLKDRRQKSEALVDRYWNSLGQIGKNKEYARKLIDKLKREDPAL
jgi:hypothetical protein